MKIAQDILLGILLALLTPLIAYAGDSPWLTIARGDKTWGVGEINDCILFYLGSDYYVFPIP